MRRVTVLNSVYKGLEYYLKRVFILVTLLAALISCGGNSDNDPDVNQAPIFTSNSSFRTLDDSLETGYLAAATDKEDDAIIYSITGGIDDVDFLIEPESGAVSFVIAPDFEHPHDENIDNIYEVEISATDSNVSDQ